MYVCNFIDSFKGCKIFLQVTSLLHPPLQYLPSFTSSLSSPLHLTLPPYTSRSLANLCPHASYNYSYTLLTTISLARSLSPLLGFPCSPFHSIPFHPHFYSFFTFFCYFLCLLYLPFFPPVLSSSLVSFLFVSSHFLPLPPSVPSLSIDFSSSQYPILSFTINLPYLTFT